MAVVRERMSSKELEVTGKWYTEEKLKQGGEYSGLLVLTTSWDLVFQVCCLG